MRLLLRATAVSAGLFCLAPLCFAASGQTVQSGSGTQMTGSGASSSTPKGPEEDTSLVSERASRLKGFPEAVKAWTTPDTQFREKAAAYARKRAELRAECRDDLRRANRDTLMTALLRCYKNDLVLERDYLEKRRAWLEALPGITKQMRATVLSRLDLLADAIDTIVYAIDHRVYATQDDLVEARRNLLTRYRLPFWESVTLARADRALTWIARVIALTDAVRTEDVTITGGERAEWLDARRCLTERETELKTLLLGESEGDKTVSEAVSDIRFCLDDLQTVPRAASPATGSGAVKTGSGSGA